MNKTEKINFLQEKINDIHSVVILDYCSLKKILNLLEMFIRKTFGNESYYLQELNTIGYSFEPSLGYREPDMEWVDGTNKLINIIDTMIEEIRLFGASENDFREENEKHLIAYNKIFIVHGHDEKMLLDVEKFVNKLKIDPIILKDQPDKSRTVIEKFEDLSDTDYAIILLSPDDYGRAKNEDDEDLKPRPRQNVIFEFGYFLGKIERENILVLYQETKDFDILSDISGVLYTPYREGWQLKIARELKAAGFLIDFNYL